MAKSRKRPETVWATKLKRLRKQLNLTQEAAAARAEIPVRTWIGWENSFRSPARFTQQHLIAVFPQLAD